MTIEDGVLVALIRGAKVDVARGKGQEWRRLEWPLEHDSALVQDLAGEVRHAGGSLVVTIAGASNFSKSMSNAAAREWPRRKASITPYCFRHQVAADMKADGQLDSGEISAALGRLSDATKSTYGHARHRWQSADACQVVGPLQNVLERGGASVACRSDQLPDIGNDENNASRLLGNVGRAPACDRCEPRRAAAHWC